jgi:hypothetical protein
MRIFSRKSILAIIFLTGFLLPVGTVVTSLVTAPTASAVNCTSGAIIGYGRRQWCGYFNNKLDWGSAPYKTGGFVLTTGIPSNINSANAFTSFIQNELNNGNAQNKTGAEFIILTMLGDNGGTSRATASADFARWKADIDGDDTAGYINWSEDVAFPCGIKNTYYQESAGSDDAFFYEPPNNASGDGCGPNAEVQSIVIKHGGSTYTIKRECANPIGDTTAIPTPPVTVTPPAAYNVTVSANSNGSPADVLAGQQYSIGVGLLNHGPNASVAGNLQVDYPGAAVTSPPAGVNPASMTPLVPTASSSYGFRNTTAIAGKATPDWYWVTTPLRNGESTAGTLKFTVSAAATPGTVITFQVWYSPDDAAGDVSGPATVTFTVISQRSPAIVGINGDVHAGGGFCQESMSAPSAGYVEGYSNAGSGTQYIVSATAGIGSFASNDATALNDLDLGSNGAYAEVCREDLLNSAAVPYYNNATLPRGMISGDVDLGTLNPAYSVFFSTGGTLELHGTVTRKITIVALNGNIEIDGNIQIGGGTSIAAATPSLGLIAAQDILIDDGVTRADAYMFADQDIDTCVEHLKVPDPCTNNLLVNGFLMANSLSLDRLGPLNTDGTPISEKIVLNPQIYLNPPTLFDSTVDNTSLEGEGEDQPLF